MRHFVDQAGGTDLVYDDGIDTLKASFDYEVDEAGNRTGAQEIIDGQTYDWTWTYDDLNRLISEQLDAGDNSLDYTTTFGFDLASNRMEERKDDGSDGATTPDEVTTYEYDANDRLLTERADTNDDGTTDQTTAYAYGANADLGSGYGGDGTSQTEKTVRDGDAVTGTFTSRTTFEYNAMGRLAVSETFSNGSSTPDTSTTYTYDDRGLRVTETTGGETKEYLFDSNNPTGYAQVLEQYVNDVLHRTYTLGNDVISQADTAAVTTGVAIHRLLYDAHGSTRAILDTAAAFIQQFAYSAYGQMLTSTNLTAASAALTNILYSGEWTQANGQQYLRARFYDPSSGRFNRLDPYAGNISDPLSLHKYAYVHGNPIMGIDPTGCLTFTYTGQLAVVAIMGTIGGIVSGTIAAIAAPAGEKAGAFFDGFFRGFLSAGITTSLILFGKAPLPIANALGSGLSSFIVDIFEITFFSEDLTFKQAAVNAAGSAMVGAIIGYVFGFLPGAKDIEGHIAGWREAIRRAESLGPSGTDVSMYSQQQLKEMLARSQAAKAAANAMYREATILLASLVTLDATISNYIPKLITWGQEAFTRFGNWYENATTSTEP